MEAVCKGAKLAGGATIGILPGGSPDTANIHVDIPIATNMGYARNVAVVSTGRAVIAVGGAYGTLSEIAYALSYGIPVVSLHSWPLTVRGDGQPVSENYIIAADPADAVEKALVAARNRADRNGVGSLFRTCSRRFLMPADAVIAAVAGREVLDSRGNPTVAAEVTLTDGSAGLALVPSGASTGSYEALELRDGDPTRYGGAGTLTAVANINGRIAPALAGMSPYDQSAVDRRLIELDGAADKSNLGANATLAASMAVARAAAVSGAGGSLWRHLAGEGPVSLPAPMLNILNGGRHASNSADVQEFMVVPAGFERFGAALRAGVEIYQALKGILRAGRAQPECGDEGGFAPALASNRTPLR